MPYAFCGVPGVDIFKSNINKRIIYNSMAGAECLWRHDAAVSGNRQRCIGTYTDYTTYAR